MPCTPSAGLAALPAASSAAMRLGVIVQLSVEPRRIAFRPMT